MLIRQSMKSIPVKFSINSQLIVCPEQKGSNESLNPDKVNDKKNYDLPPETLKQILKSDQQMYIKEVFKDCGFESGTDTETDNDRDEDQDTLSTPVDLMSVHSKLA